MLRLASGSRPSTPAAGKELKAPEPFPGVFFWPQLRTLAKNGEAPFRHLPSRITPARVAREGTSCVLTSLPLDSLRPVHHPSALRANGKKRRSSNGGNHEGFAQDQPTFVPRPRGRWRSCRRRGDDRARRRGQAQGTDGDSDANADAVGQGQAIRLHRQRFGTNADPGGRGRRCASRPHTGVTDSDTGSGSDAPDYGRGRGQTGVTDSDSGSNRDAPNYGRGRQQNRRHRQRLGQQSRRAQLRTRHAREPASPTATRAATVTRPITAAARRSCSDSDSGSNADPGGRGRRC